MRRFAQRMLAPAAAALLLLASCAMAAGQAPSAAAKSYWLRQFVGDVRLARLGGGSSPLLAVAADRGVVAALRSADGTLAWRKVLDESESVSHLDAAGGRLVALSSVPGAGRLRLRLLEAPTGTLAWEAAPFGEEARQGVVLPAGARAAGLATFGTGAGAAVAVALGGGVKAFGAAGGRELWAAALAPAGAPPAAVRLAVRDGDIIAALAGPTGDTVSVVRLAAADGSVRGRWELSTERLDAGSLVLGSAALAALTEDGSRVCVASTEGSGAQRAQCASLASLLPAGASAAGAALLPGCSAEFGLQSEGGGGALRVAGGAPRLSAFVPGATASACAADSSGTPVVGLAVPGADGPRLCWLSAADGSVVREAAVPEMQPPTAGGGALGIARVLLLPASSGAGGQTRAAMVLEDWTLGLVAASGGLAWQRPEGLAAVSDALFVDLPAPTPEHEAAWQEAQPGLGDTLRAQLISLKAQFGAASAAELAQLAAHEAAVSAALRPTRDPDGFRKQLLLATEAGTLYALHNGDGRQLWSLAFGARAAPQRLALWRVPHDLQHEIEVVALRRGAGALAAAVLGAHSGRVLRSEEVPGATDAAQLSPPARLDGADQHLFALLPRGGLLAPHGAGARAAARAALANATAWQADAESGTIRGYGFLPDGSPQERWSVAVAPPGGGSQLLLARAHTPGEAVSSYAKVLAGGALLFRALSPSTLLAVAGPRAGSACGAGGPGLSVLLLDGATGRVLLSQSHPDARGPVHGLVSENWAAWHYWACGAGRWEVGAAEAFEPPPAGLSVAGLAFAETNISRGAWEVADVQVLTQSYVSALPVSAMAATRTARGITAKQALLGTPSGQVYMLDRRWLDPRRPRVDKPTPAMQAEGLMPYARALPVAHRSFATLDRRVARLRALATEPAALESSSLLLAHGLDLFHRRLAPSGAFDMVPPDFPTALLVVVVVAMAGAAGALRLLAGRAALKQKWQ